MPKPTSKIIPVRLSDEIVKRLDNVAEMIGSNRTAVIRLCVDLFAKHIEQTGKAALPMDWAEILLEHDGRAKKTST